MAKKKTPQWKLKTPTNYPELLEEWKSMYDELIQDFPRSKVMELIAKHYGVSSATAYYHLSSSYKESQKKRPSQSFAYEKEHAERYEQRTKYRAKYVAVRRHIDTYIQECFNRTSQAALTLDDLAYCIHDQTEVLLSPDTILGLATYRYETKHGKPLICEVAGHEPSVFQLNL
jgi:hypothetical protein